MSTHDLEAARVSPADRFDALGVVMFEYVLGSADLQTMDNYFPKLSHRQAGARANAFSPDAQAWLANHPDLLELSGRLLATRTRLTRLQAFDKTVDANWFVPWHQDRAEDGRDRAINVLEQTIALRVHLDECDEANGPLEVIPGSHTQGRLTANAIAASVAATSPLLCLANRGDILAMRPLLIHRSQRAHKLAARRIIHIEYQPVERDPPLHA
jgi:ectoine hydroxylase-related dioxygenase (phytanoyl-CoA dioxygenase family)